VSMSPSNPVRNKPGLIIIEPPGAGETHTAPQAVDTSDDVGALSVHYRDGQPVIIVIGGAALAGEVMVENAAGTIVASYRAGSVEQAGAQTRNEITDVKFYLYIQDPDDDLSREHPLRPLTA
ncbi:hypothetical protein, partial [Actinokineospora xionganensis]